MQVSHYINFAVVSCDMNVVCSCSPAIYPCLCSILLFMFYSVFPLIVSESLLLLCSVFHMNKSHPTSRVSTESVSSETCSVGSA